MLARARAYEVSYSCTRSRGRDLIKARREALVFRCTKATGYVPFAHGSVRNRRMPDSSGLARVYVGWKKRWFARTQQAAIDWARKQFSLYIVRLYDATATGRCVGEIFDRFYYWMDKVVICPIVNMCTLSSICILISLEFVMLFLFFCYILLFYFTYKKDSFKYFFEQLANIWKILNSEFWNYICILG